MEQEHLIGMLKMMLSFLNEEEKAVFFENNPEAKTILYERSTVENGYSNK